MPLIDIRPDLPLALCHFVHKMIAKKPEDRYQNATTILHDLKRLAPTAKKTS